MAISAGKARVTGAGEVAVGLTDAVPMRPTYVGWDTSRAFNGGVAHHSDCADVNHYDTKKRKKKPPRLQIRYIYADAA